MTTDADLVLLRKPASEAEYLAVVSALDAADIPCLAKNARVQNLFGMGTIGTGFNLLTGPIQIWVHREDLEEAEQLLVGIEVPPGMEEDPDEDPPRLP